MSRMWLKNGRAVLADGRAVLCEECPCGCSYTYYVDHSLATSGDGHSWETAFNSVNDVFNSLEIYNYRLSGCTIYIKIKGAITYRIEGTYLLGWMSESRTFGYAHLMAQDDSSTVTCNLVTPFIVSDSFTPVRVHVHNFNITTSEPSVALSTNSIIFSDCVITVNVPPETMFGDISESFGNGSGFCLYRCIITINLGVRNIGQGGTLSYNPIFNVISGVVSNTSVIITGELTSSASSIYTSITITAINVTHGSSILENVAVSSNISFSGFGWVSVYAFNGSGTNLFSGCTFSPQIAETHRFGKIICAFGAGVVTNGSFYNCSQYCDADGSFTCSQSCPDLS